MSSSSSAWSPSYALKTDGRPLAEVEQALRRYLPGLDLRLFPYSPRQAILPGHLMTALTTDYTAVGELLHAVGVLRYEPKTDAEVVAILAARDTAELTGRPAPRAGAQGLDAHLELCRVPAAWALLGGPDAIDWTGVRVGQIDTGYTEHPVFGFPGDSWLLTDLARSFEPEVSPESPDWPPLPGPPPGVDPISDNGFNAGHGTKIGATVCGWTPARDGRRFYGVAPRVPLVPVRICNSVVINDRQRQFVQAVEHLVDVAHVQVINISLGLFPHTPTSAFKRAVDHAYARGVILVCAAGNHVREVVPPARLRRTLAVAGVTLADRPWAGSSHGDEVDFSAVSEGVRRAVTSAPGRYGYADAGDGTSYAAAMSTGAAALWLARHRGQLAARYPEPWQLVEAFKRVARASARVPAGPWQPHPFGTGVLDVHALLQERLPEAGDLFEDPANS